MEPPPPDDDDLERAVSVGGDLGDQRRAADALDRVDPALADLVADLDGYHAELPIRVGGSAIRSRTSERYRSSKMCSGITTPGNSTVFSGNRGSGSLTPRT